MVLGPTNGSLTVSAPNGATMTLSAGTNVSLVINAGGRQTCSVTGGNFSYVVLAYTRNGGAVLAGCSSTLQNSARTCSSYIWWAGNFQVPQTHPSFSGCLSGWQYGNPYCVSTCGIVNFTSVGGSGTTGYNMPVRNTNVFLSPIRGFPNFSPNAITRAT